MTISSRPDSVGLLNAWKRRIVGHDGSSTGGYGITPPSAAPLFTKQSVFCVLLLAGCLLAVWPVVELGVSDDWSYIRVAELLAKTGHFVYNGWCAPILGWQAAWGALFARLFGASFTAVRMAIIPIDLATALLFHAVLRRFGLNSSHATFGTLTLILSPLFLPLATTFMSDVPGFFPIIVCLYFCQLALAASTDRAACGWLITAALTNILLGTARQTAWLGVIVIIPCCAWLLRRRRYVIPVTIGLWTFGLICIFLVLHWFLSQTYAVPDKVLPGQIDFVVFERLLDRIARAAATTVLLCLPVLATSLPALLPLRRRRVQRGALVVVLFLSIVATLKHYHRAYLVSPPWLGTAIDYAGLRSTLVLLSPRSAPTIGMLIFLLCCLLCLWAFAEMLSGRPNCLGTQQRYVHWRSASVLLLPLLLIYCLLLLPRSAFADRPQTQLWDRYLLLVVAVLLFYMLAWHQERVGSRSPAIALLVLILFAWVGVASTHDLFARERARVRMINEIEQTGVPRTSIRGGFAFDGVTQLDAWGYINDPAIVNPPGAYHPQPADQEPCPYWFKSFVPAVHARYVVQVEPSSCVEPAPFPPVTYRIWLPPRTQFVWAGILR